MEFRILGPLELVRDGRVLRLGSGRQLALVAVLLIHANEAVSVDRLVDELWGESPPPTAAKIVRNTVSSLRRELGDRLVTQPPGYLLRVEEGELDSERLERAVARRDLEGLTDALALWRGRPLAQLAYEPFAQSEIARLEELRLAGVEAWADGQLALGRHADVIAELEGFVREHPLRERLRGQLMLALYRSGRQADALEAYRQARRSLDEQLGIEPGPELRELERKILNQDDSLGAPSRVEPALEGRRGRGLKLVVAGAFVLLAAAAAAAFLVTRDSGGGLAAIRPNSVGMIDPGTDRIVAEIPVGIRPGPVAADARSVWIANLQDRNLTKIDSRRRTTAATISLGNRTPTGVAVEAGAVGWRLACAESFRGWSLSLGRSRIRSPSRGRRAALLWGAWQSALVTCGPFTATRHSLASGPPPCAYLGRCSSDPVPPESSLAPARSGSPTPVTPPSRGSIRRRSRKARSGRSMSASSPPGSPTATEPSGSRAAETTS